MSPFLRPIVIWILGTIALATPGFAATLPVDGYVMRVWQTDDGLPQNAVITAVQTRDGYLWVGTYSGLARFDGERFRDFDSANSPGLQDSRISCLFEDAQGTLWIGHEAGTITRYREGRFEPFPLPAPTGSEKIIGIGGDEQGQLWAMRNSGALESLTNDARLRSLIGPELPGAMSWARSAHGSISLSENGRAARLTNGKLIPITLGPPRRSNYVLCTGAADDGGTWVLCDNRIRKWQDGRWTEDRGEFPWPEGSVACCVELRDGTLAVGTIYAGLYLVFKDGRRPVHFDHSNGLPQNWVRFVHEDREGSLWVGAGSAGLVSLHTTAFSVLNAPDQWQSCTVLAVAPSADGSLWIGTDGAGIYHHEAGKWTRYDRSEGLVNAYIPAVAVSTNGAVWAGNFWWGSPARLDNGRFVRPAGVDESSTPVFSLVAPAGTDELLVGNREGLVQLKNGRSKLLVKASDDSAGGVVAVVRTREGVIWCGFEEGGLARFADGTVTTFQRQDGLPTNAIECLFADSDGSLWIGTADHGLVRFKNGHFVNITAAQGLADTVVCHIVDDGLGYFWLSTRHGLQRVATTELNRCADKTVPAISSQIYDRSDGLPIIEFIGGLQASACKTPDGRLWFASSKGLISVDPSRIAPNPTPPPVVLESLQMDGKPVPVSQGAVAAHLPPDHQRLEFRFTGLSFVAPSKVLFKYRLDGIDQAWVDAGTRRTAFYSRLPAGPYRFRVIACNNDGVWNTEGAALAFTVAPFFWQTWWFGSSASLLVLTGVALLARSVTRRRLHRRMEQLERQNAIERERARIAQDIHDDIGTSLTRIAMFTQADRSELKEPQQAAAVLARILATTREMTRSLDEIVWAIDPRHDTLDGLASYMGRFAQDLLAAAAIRCRLDLPVDLPAWHMTAETRHNLFLAFKEALNNTVKHSSATEVRITMKVSAQECILTVKDNGRGFDPTQPGATRPDRIASGNGLPSLERRLARIGGRCEIRSEPGSGTTVSFIIRSPDQRPGSAAPGQASRSSPSVF